MNRFKSKKGFTLAELLIVVAIIAVLVAIAVPLFVGGLQKAEENVQNANKRAVREAAVATILSEYDAFKLATTDKCWKAVAGVKANGELTGLTVSKSTSDAATDTCAAPTKDDTAYTDCKYVVTVYLTETALPKTPTT